MKSTRHIKRRKKNLNRQIVILNLVKRKVDEKCKENTMNFYVSEATMYFEVENIDGEGEVVVEVATGNELIEKIDQFVKEEFYLLFAREELPVLSARLKYIEITHEQDGINFKLKLNGDDGSYGSLIFDQKTLQDENAKKIALVREVLDFDKEGESLLLRDLLK